MTREEKTNLLNELLEYEENNDIGNLTRAERREFQQWISEVLEQQPENAISRQVALDIYDDYNAAVENGELEAYRKYRNQLLKLPPVQPKTKTKRCKWIRYDYRTVCPQNHDVNNPFWRIPENRMDTLKYCPYCGREIEVTE